VTPEFWGLAFGLLIYASKGEQQSKLAAISRTQCVDVLRSAFASLFPVGQKPSERTQNWIKLWGKASGRVE
jgi:hypothetical protein